MRPPNLIDILSLDLPSFIVGIGIHEFAHAFAADRMGDPTPRSQGRVSLNPIEHLDPIGTLLPIFLSLQGSPVAFGWGKPVQYDPGNFRNPNRGSGITAIAGPLSNLMVCCVVGILLTIASNQPDLWRAATTPVGNYFYRLLFRMFSFNLGLFLFNLLPIPPLDGSKVVCWLGGEYVSELMRKMQPYSLMILIGFLMSHMDSVLLYPLFIKLTIFFTGPLAHYVFAPAQFIADFL
ncbi:MAG: site-2 protease family protein [Candidatus Riflebacteria bacterium]|nr:site-2 protease family protein [Candidatus Riflebacteria bacterium]